jgi:hypothetical protein
LLVPSVADYLTCARSGELEARLYLEEHDNLLYNLLVLLLAITKYRHEGSGAQLASYLGLDIINNVREARDSLHRIADIGNASWCECLVR